MEIRRKKSRVSLEEFSTVVLPMLEKNIDVTITTTGNSMYPLWVHKRDSVLLTSCDKFNLRKGDIPLYKRANGQYVLHRIVKVNKDSYDMCGDAQWNIEYSVPKENIIAVVKAFTRKGKEYSCKSSVYSAYSILWMWLFPLRKLNIRIYRKLGGI
jgi:hypothetical protein